MSVHEPSDDFDLDVEARSERGVLYRLLDPAFGFFVWAIYFLLVYGGVATICAVHPDPRALLDAGPARLVAVALTVLVILGLVWHALASYRRHRQAREQHFLMWITVGHDAIAAVAVGWMLFPLLLLPACS